ncbi:MAG: J domain-containing protein [Nitrospinae bacterium]|nr:J domain-containing protein [Nitrospinota bacterium]MCH8311576.1 J domain-containing protein [Nitrospinota bacterium]
MELSTLKGELHLFERRYHLVVGAKYTELDEVKAQILELASRLYPRSDEFRAGAQSARERAQGSAKATEDGESDSPEGDVFKPNENLKKLFREVAKKIHPDLASDEKEKNRRHVLMAKLNQAYDRLDEEAIHAVLLEWEAGHHPEKNQTLGTQLVKIVRQVAQIKKRLSRIEEELVEIKNSGMHQLMKKMASAEKTGVDLLEEMAASVDEKIDSIKSKVRDLAGEFD